MADSGDRTGRGRGQTPERLIADRLAIVAAVYGVAECTVRHWRLQGMPGESDGARGGRYDLTAIGAWLRNRPHGGGLIRNAHGMEWAEEVQRQRAIEIEYRNRQTAEELVELDDFDRVTSDHIQHVGGAMGKMVSDLISLVGPADRERVGREVRNTMSTVMTILDAGREAVGLPAVAGGAAHADVAGMA